MTKNSTCTDSASADTKLATEPTKDQERMMNYKRFAVAFSYPEEDFFDFFTDMKSKRDDLAAEYDDLFRAREIWLYGSEYVVTSEFQITANLSDIMGFYRAFGLETNLERPDSLFSELEFMHYLIFKKDHALKAKDIKKRKEKVKTCAEAQEKFFKDHLYPAATKITQAINSKAADGFYKTIAGEMIEFLESEKKFFGEVKQ